MSKIKDEIQGMFVYRDEFLLVTASTYEHYLEQLTKIFKHMKNIDL